MTTHHLHELSRSECFDILRSAAIGRVGLSIEALPAIFPVFLAVVDDFVVFPTLAGTALASGSMGTIVALQVDTFDPVDEMGYSVLVRGFADAVTDPDRSATARERLHPTWVADARSQLIQVAPTLVSGQRFGPSGGA